MSSELSLSSSLFESLSSSSLLSSDELGLRAVARKKKTRKNHVKKEDGKMSAQVKSIKTSIY